MAIKEKIHIIIFGTDTKAGKLFDIILLWTIIFSMASVILESVSSIQKQYYNIFELSEWFFSILFGIEYILRIVVTKKPLKYILSYWGVIDLLSFIPSFIGLLLGGVQYLIIIRTLRLLRVFRVLKLTRYTKEARVLINALKNSFRKIIIFLSFIVILVIIMGTFMYVIEGDTKGFRNIPESIYWAIVTITTVGYGDVTPNTVIGKIVSSGAMLIGYAIIAIPTGIVTIEMTKNAVLKKSNLLCKGCKAQIDKIDNFCRNCGKDISN